MSRRLLFCDALVLERWVAHRVAERANRQLRKDASLAIQQVSDRLESYRGDGLKLACTVNVAAHLVTSFYKAKEGELPFSGETRRFPIRKSFAREAAQLLRQSVELLAPSAEHFKHAEELWYVLCQKEIKVAYAGFSDYLDAALVMNPPEGTVIPQVALGHHHVSYILKKSRSPQIVHHLL